MVSSVLPPFHDNSILDHFLYCDMDWVGSGGDLAQILDDYVNYAKCCKLAPVRSKTGCERHVS